MRSPSLRRRIAVGGIAIGLVSVGPLVSGLDAGAAPGSGLGSVNVSALATGLRMPFYSHQGEDVEAELPFALSQLGAGGLGHALTTMFWPGYTGASGGSTLAVIPLPLPVTIPSQLENALNDSFKAEAPTTTGQTSSSMSNPGLTMQALALPTHVNAVSAFGPANSGSQGDNSGPAVNTVTNIAYQGADTVVADAKTAIYDLTVGPLSIGSLVSTAHATSNGKTSTGETQTVISDVSIAGVAVTIDQNGVEIAKNGVVPASVAATLTSTVNTALKNAGMTVILTKATKSVHGPEVNLDSGDLLLLLNHGSYNSNYNDTGTFLELGGASITANSVPAYVAPVTTGQSTSPPSTAPGNNSLPPVSQPPTLPNTTSQPPSTAPPLLAAKPLALPGALSPWWIVGAALLAGLGALLLGMLPGRALAGATAACRIEEES